MTQPGRWPLRDLAATGARAFDEMRTAADQNDTTEAARHALVSIACSLYRIAGIPAPRAHPSSGIDADHDVDEMAQDREETWHHDPDDDTARLRRLDRD